MGDISKYSYGLQYTNKYNYKNRDANIDTYVTYMMNRTHSMFKYTGLPDTIPERILELYIQNNGHCCIAEHNGELYAFTGGMGGEPDVYYMPTEYIVANPALKLNKTFKIDKDCVIIPNDTMYMGLLPLHNKYASMLVENEISVFMAMYNTRIMALMSASDERTKASVQDFIKSVVNGELACIGETALIDSLKTYPWTTSNTGTIKPLIENEQYWRASWLNELGLNANFNMKRERINSSETELNVDSLRPLIDDMLECREKAVEQINEMFGTNITVGLNSSWSENNGDTINDDNSASGNADSDKVDDTSNIVDDVIDSIVDILDTGSDDTEETEEPEEPKEDSENEQDT